ncbi:RNA polymerase RpoN-/SigL-like sigma 54 subunit [Stella humosa]|uniref:RNA polymerase sigma-54 factor n=1 Tax=Stella humosa TaxID=94 RepID=A0A3N1LCA2_9PROT|nr:RNA polymerase factor sigma-54 [Stella humosa]ROP90661.1 RNA polymerase RpoN-/SigL-like sigma 54 subunit [Stella humosa]BBK29440.1 RNA polymerase sigma-54 factor [Stella humosa]
MLLAPRLELRQSQSLVMTPQLQQAIKLLQMSNLELAAFVDDELERNPLLEREDGAPPAGEAPERPEPAAEAEGPFGEEFDEYWHPEESTNGPADGGEPAFGGAGGEGDGLRWNKVSGGSFEDGSGDPLDSVQRAETLRDHLLTQLMIEIADAGERLIGLHIVDGIAPTGYLEADVEVIAGLLGCPAEQVLSVLARMQRFDPPGVFARSLAECLALQLEDRGRLTPAMRTMLDHLDLLARRDRQALCRLCQVDGEALAAMMAEIRSLDPKPGLVFDSEPAQPIVPDIMMRPQSDGGWAVELNPDTLPQVLVNHRYFTTVSRGTRDKGDRGYLAERLQSANWLVRSMHQRATTILRVAAEIVRQQHGFFMHGVAHLRPLVLRDIAAAVSLHESTISRVTSNKYIATPRGIFELKYFFTASIQSVDGGAAHSAEAVRHRIRTLIDGEAADRVLSDDQIVSELQRGGVDIARRTVAKYREAMRIPSSVERRRAKWAPA